MGNYQLLNMGSLSSWVSYRVTELCGQTYRQGTDRNTAWT